MKVVSFDEFVTLPNGTVFCEWGEVACSDFAVKGDTLFTDYGDGPRASDFYSLPLLPFTDDGETAQLSDAVCRWGMCDYAARFAVYEPADVAKLRWRLSGANPMLTEEGDADG